LKLRLLCKKHKNMALLPDELHSLLPGRDDGTRMPVIFFGHGSPMNAIEDNVFSETWSLLGKSLPRPEAILSISAHWETNGMFVTAMQRPRTIHDFGGFPRELYEVSYPAPGSPVFAASTRETVRSRAVLPDHDWGLDHGTWSILRRLFPAADVPVFQLSLDMTMTPEEHYRAGKELSALRDKGILIMGSGNIVHNLRKLAWEKLDEPGFGYDWALEADEQVRKWIMAGDHNALVNFRAAGKAFDMAIPTAEHFLPLLYVLGASSGSEPLEFFNDQAVAGSLTMTSLKTVH
jgi:4,5-DOPA dioxygenase extradiol